MHSSSTYIYSLSDPFTGLVRYIGKADDLRVRYNNHVSLKGKESTRKSAWVKSLIKKGAKPIIEIVDFVDKAEWKFWEQFYISLFKSWGFVLVNSTDGGEGLVGYKTSDETKQKLRLANLGKKHSDETKAKMRLNSPKCWLGKERSDEDKKKFSESHKGKKQSKELIEKRMLNMRGEKHHFYGKPLPDAVRQKIKDSWVIRKNKKVA
jgi:group I intron endonuclease